MSSAPEDDSTDSPQGLSTEAFEINEHGDSFSPSLPREELENETETPVELAERFADQGLRYDAALQTLWCGLCTRMRSESSPAAAPAAGIDALPPLPASWTSWCDGNFHLARVIATPRGVLAHCATKTHLQSYETHRARDLAGWCAVEIQGKRMLLEHHAIYPARVFGEGRLLMDETLAGGGLLGVDVCGGVKLWPYHKYRVVELVPPAAITQTRDVVAHSQKDSATETTIPARLVYEFPTLPPTPTAPSAFREGEIKRGKRARDSTSEAVGNETDPGQPGLPRLPSFFDEDQRARSKKARAHNIKEVLKGVNASVIGEAKLRYRRKKNIAKYNC